jgi:hypothetical protein
VSDFGDRILDDALAQGRRNAETVELARRHCLHMTFVEWGGQGMAEAVTGLPINMRRVECPQAQGGASGNLDWIATDFVRENCEGCAHRQPTGEVPNLATVVADRDEQAAAAAEASQAETDRAVAAWARRAERRRSLLASCDTAMSSVVNDLGILDSDPGVDADASVVAAALRRLTAVAERAPEALASDVIDHMLDLVASFEIGSVLGPLRYVARSRNEFADRVLDVAVGTLRRSSQIEAGRCLVELSGAVRPESLDESVVRSLVYLAGMRSPRFPGQPAPAQTHDPAPLRAAAEIVPETVETTLRGLLPPPGVRSSLILPPGEDRSPQGGYGAESDRAAAARSVTHLASTHPDLSAALVGDLIRNLGVDGTDDYDEEPIHNVKRALATMLVLQVGNVEEALEAEGRNSSDVVRARLFDVYELAAGWLDPDGGRREPGDPRPADARSVSMFDELMSVATVRVAGDWGDEVAFSGAALVEQLAGDRPDLAAERLDQLLGCVLSAVESVEKPRPSADLLVPGRPVDGMAGLVAVARSSSYSSAAHRLLRAVEQIAAVEPLAVCQAISDVIAEQRDNERGVAVLWRLIPTLGRVGSRHGAEPGVLRCVLPTLHTYLVDQEAMLRAAALEAWTDIGKRHSLPSSLADLLPAFLDDATVGVVGALLGAARSLRWSESDEARLLIRAFEVCKLVDGAEHPDLLKSSISTLAVLAARVEGASRNEVERFILSRAIALDGYDLRDVLRGPWLESTARSGPMAELRLRQARDPRINDRLNAGDDEQLRALLDCGAGLLSIPCEDLVASALELSPNSPLGAAEFAEVAWLSGRVDCAEEILKSALSATPDVPAYSGHRAILELVLCAAALDRELMSGEDGAAAAARLESAIASLDEQEGSLARLRAQVQAVLRIRGLLSAAGGGPSSAASTMENDVGLKAADARRARAAALEESAVLLEASSQVATATGAYVRAFAGLCLVGVDLLRFDASELDADPRSAEAHAVAARRRAADLAAELNLRFAPDDPLVGPLLSALADAEGIQQGAAVASVLAGWRIRPLPLLVVEGPRRTSRPFRGQAAAPDTDVAEPSVGVVLASVDGRLITGPQVLRPNQVYELQIEVRPGPWPDWAQRLDAELVGHLTEAEIQTPTFTWLRPPTKSDDEVLTGAGTLLLRFALAAGRPAPPFLVKLHWMGERDGKSVSEPVDVAGHDQLRFRPFDASRDFLTDFEIFDERLLALYERLHGAGYSEDHLQAFCRLLTAVCRVGLRMTWDKKYKRGAYVSERTFHDDLHQKLLEEPELEGRVERGTPLGLGFLDVRHDKVTAELKVERKTPVTTDTAPKYMGQPTQYAAADGARLSILCVLDMTRKTSPVGTPENYLFTLEPALHGLENPEAPSLVAVLIVNGNLPSPSSWSRRKAAVRQTAL